MRGYLLAGLAVCSVTGCAQAGPFGRRSACAPDGGPAPPRHPFLATVVQPAIDYAPRWPNGRPMRVLPFAVEGVAWGLTFSSNPVLVGVGVAIGPAIRLGRVVLNGSPVPGPPRDTLLWIASPYLLGFRNAITGQWVGGNPGYGGPVYAEPVYDGPVYYGPPVVVYPGP